MSDTFKINGDIGIGELSPGSTGRRYIPDGGERKLRERIHSESKKADSKNLPFTFSKPKKESRKKIVKCDSCGNTSYVGLNTVGIICSKCNKYCSVTDIER